MGASRKHEKSSSAASRLKRSLPEGRQERKNWWELGEGDDDEEINTRLYLFKGEQRQRKKVAGGESVGAFKRCEKKRKKESLLFKRSIS